MNKILQKLLSYSYLLVLLWLLSRIDFIRDFFDDLVFLLVSVVVAFNNKNLNKVLIFIHSFLLVAVVVALNPYQLKLFFFSSFSTYLLEL